jgi:O-antigen/teichoic acid export membrane protein
MNNVYALLSQAHHAADNRFQAIEERAAKYILAYTLPLTAGLAAGASAIIPALFGAGFEPAVDALRLMAVALTFHGLLEVYWRALAARGRQDAVLRVQLVMIVARLGGGALIIAPLAVIGAAIATAANTGLHVLLLARSAGKHGAGASIFRTSWRIGLASAIMGSLVWLLVGRIELWLLVPFGAATYGLALAALRAFSTGELRQLRASLPGKSAPTAR